MNTVVVNLGIVFFFCLMVLYKKGVLGKREEWVTFYYTLFLNTTKNTFDITEDNKFLLSVDTIFYSNV